jgi:hypothetical protein
MKGSLIQLVSNGAKDIILTSEPHITYFKSVFRKYTNFGTDTLKLDFEGNMEFGETMVCNIDKIGDLLTKIYLEIDIPKVSLSKDQDTNLLNTYTTNVNTFTTELSNFKIYADIQLDIYRQIFPLLDITNTTFTSIYDKVTDYFTNQITSKLGGYNTAIGALQSEYKIISNQANLDQIVKDILIQNASASDTTRLSLFKTKFSQAYLQITSTYEYLQNKVLENTKYMLRETDNKHKFKWIEYFAFFMIDKLTIEVGDKELESISGEQLYLEYLLKRNKYNDDIFNKLIGNISILTNYNREEKPSYKMIIPLDLNFTKNYFNSIPLVALNYHDVRVILKLQNINKIIKTEYTLPLNSQLNVTNISLFADFIYLDNDERERFCTGKLFYLIEQARQFKYTGIKESSIEVKLPFSNPTKELYFYVKKKSDIKNNIMHTYYYSRKVNNETVLTCPYKAANLKLNGYDKILKKDFKYFNYIQPYEYHNGDLPLGLGLYSFSLFPDQYQPSGFCNFSNIKVSTLQLDFEDIFFNSMESSDELHLFIFSKSYNFMLIQNGMAHIQYSN